MATPATITVSEAQIQILRGLYEYGGLTTSQIRHFIVPALSPSRAFRELNSLRTTKRVRSISLVPTEGRSELYWSLRPAGARMIGHTRIDRHCPSRIPNHIQIAHKTTILEIASILEDAGWWYIRPMRYNSRHPKPDQTPQRTAIQYAVQHHFDHQPPTLPGAGMTLAATLHPSQVPVGLNDWVAWNPNHPEQAIIIIPHPAGASRGFWGRPPRNGGAIDKSRLGRIQVYANLAPVVPVLAIFPTQAIAAQYKSLLERAHFHVGAPSDLLKFLAR
jgi:hypothetical protein